MRKNDRGESSGVGQLGQLVQIPGDSFELGHVVQMLAPHPFFDSSEFDQFADDLGGLLARLPGEEFQLKIQRRIEPGTDDVFLSLGGAQCRAPAPVKFSFHNKSILRLDQRDYVPTDGSKPVFVYENTNLPFPLLVGIWRSVRSAIGHTQLSSLRLDRDDLCDGLFHVTFAEQDTPADFVGFDFSAINSGCKGNEGNFQECSNLFTGKVMFRLLSSVGRLHLSHLFADGFSYHFGEPFNG